MNKVILTGRFTRDPESRMGSNNTEISRFSLACQNDFATRDGERSTEFINCVAFGRTAQTINKFCKKGRLISATGRIRNSSYDAQDGSKRYTTDVIVENFEFLGGTGASNEGSYSNNNQNDFDAMSNIETTDVTEDPYKDFGEEVNISSDDLPF
jgi:single-strand DNA-binding protein